MTLLQAFFLGLIQGITEFLPISSSGHLVLAESFLGLKFETLRSFDVVLHLGSLAAILVYFWTDFKGLVNGFLSFLKLKKISLSDQNYQKLIFYLIIGTIPAVVVGLTLEDFIDRVFRDPRAVSLMMVFLALFFLLAEKFPKVKNKTQVNLKNSLLMGLAQAVALIPGISRSGSIIGAGLFRKIKRAEAARFAFLLGIPAILGASLFTSVEVLKNTEILPGLGVSILGFFTSAFFGFLSVKFLMKFLKNHRLNIFAYYLLAASGFHLLSLYF